MNPVFKTALPLIAISLCFPLFALNATEMNAQEMKVNVPFKADPARGHQTAQKLCASCHIVSKTQKGPVHDGVPSFSHIGNLGGQNMQRLAVVMIHPKKPMIDLHLTTHEIKDIAAYILSLGPKPK